MSIQAANARMEAPPPAANAQGGNQKSAGSSSPEYLLRKYLLLLVTLVATVTYVAGLNLPGGTWLEDTLGGQVAGDSILRHTNYMRYIVFYYFNAISFSASLLVGLLLLVLHPDDGQVRSNWLLLLFVRLVMVVDLLGLMGAYGVGSSHDGFTIRCGASLLASGVVLLLSYIAIWTSSDTGAQPSPGGKAQQPAIDENTSTEKELEMLLVLAIFAATMAYVAGLNPPGGFWRISHDGHTAGDPVLQADHPRRYKAFFFLNTTAFVASLVAIVLVVVSYNKLQRAVRNVPLYCSIIIALLGLAGAYAAGSCRDGKHTCFVLLLTAPVGVCIYLAHRLRICFVNNKKKLPCFREEDSNLRSSQKEDSKLPCIRERYYNKLVNYLMQIPISSQEALEKSREYIQLLAILAATVAYQAGLDPPGGVWSGSEDGHSVGDPILLTTHPGRYKVFFYFNSAAFVASLVIMGMLQNEKMVRGHALHAAMILDLFGLIGAYAAGSCRDNSTSIYTVAIAGAVLIYVVIHIVFFTLDTKRSKSGDEKLESKREVLLLLAILAATLTYQAGMTPPGGLWEEDNAKSGGRAGYPVLLDKYPRRYKAFFYCNAASFMASMALIVLLLNPNMYLPGIQCYALVVCMVAGLFGLMGAYAAGSSMHLRTSIVVLVLMAVLFVAMAVLAMRLLIRFCREPTTPFDKNGDNPAPRQPKNNGNNPARTPPKNGNGAEEAMKPMYLMLVGILGASLTYLTGLKPPGGMWRYDGNGHSAGNPVLYDINKWRYNFFFYSNSASFVASITIIALLLSRMMMSGKDNPVMLHTAMVLDLLALLGAYAAGSDRQTRRSVKVILLVPIVLVIVVAFVFVSRKTAIKEVTVTGPESPTQPPPAAADTR